MLARLNSLHLLSVCLLYRAAVLGDPCGPKPCLTLWSGSSGLVTGEFKDMLPPKPKSKDVIRFVSCKLLCGTLTADQHDLFAKEMKGLGVEREMLMSGTTLPSQTAA